MFKVMYAGRHEYIFTIFHLLLMLKLPKIVLLLNENGKSRVDYWKGKRNKCLVDFMFELREKLFVFIGKFLARASVYFVRWDLWMKRIFLILEIFLLKRHHPLFVQRKRKASWKMCIKTLSTNISCKRKFPEENIDLSTFKKSNKKERSMYLLTSLRYSLKFMGTLCIQEISKLSSSNFCVLRFSEQKDIFIKISIKLKNKESVGNKLFSNWEKLILLSLFQFTRIFVSAHKEHWKVDVKMKNKQTLHVQGLLHHCHAASHVLSGRHGSRILSRSFPSFPFGELKKSSVSYLTFQSSTSFGDVKTWKFTLFGCRKDIISYFKCVQIFKPNTNNNWLNCAIKKNNVCCD